MSDQKNRLFISGFWLFLGLPLSGLLVFAVGSFLDMQFVIGIGDNRMIFAFFLGNFIAAFLWARSLLMRLKLDNYRWAPVLAGTAFGASIVAGEVFGLFDLLVDGLGIRGNVALEFSAFFVPWTGLITGLTGLALGLGLKDQGLAWRLLALGTVTGIVTFGLAIVVPGFFGFKVGVARPDGLPSMPIITVLGIWSAALIGTEVMGRAILSADLDNQIPSQT